MAIIHLPDLVPSIFDFVVLDKYGQSLRAAERDAIIFGIVTSLRWAALREARARHKPVSKIVTSDRFTNRWLSRHEIIHRIDGASGLGWQLSALALSLTESRIDSFVEPLEVIGLGQIFSSKESSGRFENPLEQLQFAAGDDVTVNSQLIIALVESTVALRPARSWTFELERRLAIEEPAKHELAPSFDITPEYHEGKVFKAPRMSLWEMVVAGIRDAWHRLLFRRDRTR